MISTDSEMGERCIAGFREWAGRDPEVVVQAPGRLEILGNHTDYNEGYTLSVPVDRFTWFAAARSKGSDWRVRDLRDDLDCVFPGAAPGDPVPGDWGNYLKGIASGLNARDAGIAGLDGMLISDVPMCAGMSSSAALEMAVGLAAGHLAGADLQNLEWAKIGQACEEEFIGARTGLLDQLTILEGAADSLVWLDHRTFESRQLPFPSDAGFLVADSGVRHDLTVEYNDRRTQCELAATQLATRIPGALTLRDVNQAMLEAQRSAMQHTPYRRARHVVGENDRVWRGVSCLRRGDLDGFGALLTESHDSSRVWFENSCPELDVLVETAVSLPDTLGARLSGGGFGGVMICLLRAQHMDLTRRRLATAMALRTGEPLTTFTCGLGHGVKTYV